MNRGFPKTKPAPEGLATPPPLIDIRPRACAQAIEPGPVSQFTVRPTGQVWRLQHDLMDDLVFTSSADAETEARRLAQAFAAEGRDAGVEIYDGDDLLIGTAIYFATGPGGGGADAAA